MVNNKIEKSDRENFGFSLKPIYSFSRLMQGCLASTWSGRGVYLLSHAFGKIPYFNEILAIALQILSGLTESKEQKTKIKATRVPFQQDKALDNDDEAEKSKELTEKGFDWDNPADRKEETADDPTKDDPAFARLLQESFDAEEAYAYQDDKKRTPDAPYKQGDDQSYAEWLQAQYYEEDVRKTVVQHDRKKPVIPPIDMPPLQKVQRAPKDIAPARKQRHPRKSTFEPEDQTATIQILSTPGLKLVKIKDEDDKEPVERMELCREGLRGAVAMIGKERPQAISPAALKAQRGVDLEQYIALELKRFGHTQELKGSVTLPSGNQLKLEGFHDVFTAPMIMSSFKDFVEETGSLNAASQQAILNRFKDIIYCDYVSKNDIQGIVTKLHDPGFAGPIIMSAGFDIHSAVLMWYKGYLIYCDRGSDNIEHGIYVFNIPNRELITEDFLWERAKKKKLKKRIMISLPRSQVN